jgi:hypothetical protein
VKIQCYCPDLSKEEFDLKDLSVIDLSGKTFYTSRIPMVSHFPMNPEIKIQKTLAEIEKKGFETVAPLFTIFEDGLLFGRVLIEIIKPSDKEENVVTFTKTKIMCKCFSGAKHLVPKALKEFDGYLMAQKQLTTEFYFWYHSCKLCVKEKGNRTVILGKIKE